MIYGSPADLGLSTEFVEDKKDKKQTKIIEILKKPNRSEGLSFIGLFVFRVAVAKGLSYTINYKGTNGKRNFKKPF